MILYYMPSKHSAIANSAVCPSQSVGRPLNRTYPNNENAPEHMETALPEPEASCPPLAPPPSGPHVAHPIDLSVNDPMLPTHDGWGAHWAPPSPDLVSLTQAFDPGDLLDPSQIPDSRQFVLDYNSWYAPGHDMLLNPWAEGIPELLNSYSALH